VGDTRVRSFFVVFGIGLCATAVAGAALAYDGSYLVFRMLEGQWPWVEHGRLTHFICQVIPLAASRITHDVSVIGFLLSLGYASLPMLALAACWRMVREQAPWLFVWAALGVGLASLPGLFCLVADTMLVEQMAWPLFLGALVGIPRERATLATMLCLVVAASHPVAFAVLGVAAGLAWFGGAGSPDDRRRQMRWAGVFLALALAVLLRVVIGADAYEKSTFAVESFTSTFGPSVRGWPMWSVALAWVAGLLIFGERVLARRPTRAAWTLPLLRASAVAALCLAGAALLPWAWNPRAWAGAIGYRLYLGFVMGPFVLAALCEWRARLAPGRPSATAGVALPSRRVYLWTIAAACSAVLVVQSWSWMTLTRRLESTVAQQQERCVSFDAPAYQWAAHTALSHWSISTFSLLVQGERPHTVVLPRGMCSQIDLSAGLYLAPWYTHTWDGRWFDFGRLRP
jgi:hypothetical protein